MNDAAENLWRRQFPKCKELVTLGDQRPVRVDGAFRIGARARRVDDGCGIIRTNRAAEAQIFLRAARDGCAQPNEIIQRHQGRIGVAEHAAVVDHDELAQVRKLANQRQDLVDMLLIFRDQNRRTAVPEHECDFIA